MPKISLVFLIFSLFFSDCFALELRTALEIGVSNSDELKKARSSQKSSESLAWQYKSEVFPELSARGSAEKKLSSSATFNSSTNEYDLYTVALDFKQPIFSGLALVSGWKLANLVEKKSDHVYFESQQQIVKNIIFTFYQLAEKQEHYRASQQNLKIIQDYAKTLTYYAKIGRGREMDRLQASVNASLAAVDLEATAQDVLAAELNLKKLLNWSTSEQIQISQNLHVSHHEKKKTSELTKANLDQLLSVASQKNPTLKALEMATLEADYQADVELALDRPSLDIIGSYGSQALNRDTLFESSSEFYSYGLSLKIPLFSGFSSISKKRELKEKIYQAKKSFEIQKRDIKSEIEIAQNQLKKLYRQYQDLKDVSARSQKALDLVNKSYQQGTSSSQDVVNFQRSRYEAERVLIQNQYNYLRALIELQQILGHDLYRLYAQEIENE